jgi:hypothetical protein
MAAPQPSRCPRDPGRFLSHAIAVSIRSRDAKYGDHIVVWYTQREGLAYRTWKTDLHVAAALDRGHWRVLGLQRDPQQPRDGTTLLGIQILNARTAGTKWPSPDFPVKHWWVEGSHITALTNEIAAVIRDNTADPYAYGTAFLGRTMNCSKCGERILRAAGINYVTSGSIFSTPSELMGASMGGQITRQGARRWNPDTQRYAPKFYERTTPRFQPQGNGDGHGMYWLSRDKCRQMNLQENL